MLSRFKNLPRGSRTALIHVRDTVVRVTPAAARGAVGAGRAGAAHLRRPGSRFAIQVAVTVVLLGALGLLAVYVVPNAGGARPVAQDEPSGSADPYAPIALPPGAAALPGAPGVPVPTGSSLPTPTPNPTTTTSPSSSLSGWAGQMASKVGISERAIQAYGAAEVRLTHQQPGCHLSWTTLAGIGSVETNHGTTGGTKLGDDGRPLTPIRGPALDGSNGNKEIPDTDNGQWDGDDEWDRAVGPMQFIPSTWKKWATDADGDGRADPNDIDDAALSAGKYLCHGGRDLATATGWYQAVWSYNHLDSYVLDVYDRADAYGRKSAA